MSLRERAEGTAKAIAETLQRNLGGDEHAKVVKIVEDAIIKAVLDERERCVTVANRCCPEDMDRAHKIAREIRRAEGALVANLQGLR